MRRIDFYRIATGDDLGDPETWNDRFEDLDLRADKLERDLADVNAVGDRVEGVALQRINDVILPLVTEAQERLTDLTNLFAAASATSVEVGTGTKTFVITDGFRDTWVVPEYVFVEKVGDPTVWMSGRSTSFNRSTGQFIMEAEDFGGAGTVASWGMSVSGRRGPIGERGETGLVFRGVYSAGANYVLGDVVRFDRSAWVSKGLTIGHSPPDLPTTSNAYWDLLSEHGADGTGAVAIPTVYTETVAGGAKTVFTIAGGYSATASKAVYLNGVKQPPSAFTATNGTTVVMGASQANGVLFEFNAYASFALADVLQRDLNLSDLSNADTALVNLGGTAVGRAVFKAADQAAARSAIGAPASSHGHAITDVANLQTALDAKAPKASPTFTGLVTIPTPADGDNTQIAANTEWVQGRILKRIRADAPQLLTGPEQSQARVNIGAMASSDVSICRWLAGGVMGAPAASFPISLVTHIANGFKQFRLRIHELRPSVDDNNLRMDVSTNGGTSWISTSSYRYQFIVGYGTDVVGEGSETGATTAMPIAVAQSNGVGNGVHGVLEFLAMAGEYFDLTALLWGFYAGGGGSNANLLLGENTNGGVNALRFRADSGSLASFRWSLMGVQE